MKKYIAILTASSTSKEVMTISADDHDEALELAIELADDLTDDGVFDVSDTVDVDVYELNDLPEISAADECLSRCRHDCEDAMSKLVRLIRETDGALSDEAMARVLLNALDAMDEE